MTTKEQHDERQKALQIEKIKLHEEEEAILSIECGICGEESSDHFDEISDLERTDFAKDMYKEGWRYSTSKTYGIIGVLCPECYLKKDLPAE